MAEGSLRINKPLTNMSVYYKNEDYIADKVIPDVPVKAESDLYWIYASDFRLEDTARQDGSAANQITWKASTGSYSCTENALKDIITKRQRNNADSTLMLEKHTTEKLIDKLMLRQERDANNLLFTTTTFSNNATLNTATSWNYNTTTSAPIQNVLSATTAIILASGKRPNTMVTNINVFASLKENANIYNRIQYVKEAILTEQLLASIFDMKEFHVGTAIYDQAKEGATESLTSLWEGDAVVMYKAPRPMLRDATTAIRMRVKQFGSPYIVRKYKDEIRDGDWIEVQTMYDTKAVATSCGYLFKTAALI